MLAVSAVLPDTMPDHPPLILIHSSANSAAVWRCWQQALAEQRWPSYAIDLRGHGQSGPRDLSHTSSTSTAARRSTRKGSQRNQALLWGSGILPCRDEADGRMGLPHG